MSQYERWFKGLSGKTGGLDEESDKDDKKKGKGGIMTGSGPVNDLLRCLFDASEIDYDYED